MRSLIRPVPTLVMGALLCAVVAGPVHAQQAGGCPMMRGQSGMHGRMAMRGRMVAMRGGMGPMHGAMAMMARPMGGMGGGAGDTAPRPAPARAAAQGGCPAITAKAVERGRGVFGGAGLCYVCHGFDAHGTALAPSLTDREWVDIDGSYGAIVGLVRTGVAQPKRSPAPMPPRGGSTISDADLCAVSAYVRSLARR